MSQPKITIYSTATCGFCKMLRSYLNSKEIKYDLKMADEDQNLAKELIDLKKTHEHNYLIKNTIIFHKTIQDSL